MKVNLRPIFAFALLLPSSGFAVAVATPGGSHTTAPLNGAPWDNVLNVPFTSGSAVYLGGGWVLTANHVFDDLPSATSSSVVFEGLIYDADPLHIYELANPISITGTGGTAHPDLRLYRLSNSLSLPTISLGSASLTTDVTMIGYGGGKSWGTNTVEATGFSAAVNGRNTQLFFTDYDSGTSGEGQGITGDSGGGTFYEVTVGPPSNQGWYLGGIMVAVGSLTQGGQSGTFHADVGTYQSAINGIISANGNAPAFVPEPTSLALTTLGLLAFLRRTRK